LLPREDKDVAAALLEFLHLDGVDVRLNVEVTRVEGSSGSAVVLSLATSAGTPLLEGSDIQRAPQNDGARHLDLGRVRRQPTVLRIFPKTVSASSTKTSIAVRKAHATGSRHSVFSPIRKIARAGLNENEPVAAGRQYRVAKLPMEAVLRARTLSETRGLMKAFGSDDSDEILGFTAVGPHSGGVMAVVQTAMMGKLP
jgi:pyruvate/2-oxoglutarate dehydrogenase complex dihydrolipoamide dehydrogenase (E3) component